MQQLHFHRRINYLPSLVQRAMARIIIKMGILYYMHYPLLVNKIKM